MSETKAIKKPSYRLYIDESGDHTYNLLDDPSHRYLALLGVWFKQSDDYLLFTEQLENFKRDIFGIRPDKPVIIHRSDVINRRGPFGKLCDVKICNEFDAGIIRIVAEAQFKLACVVIDKKAHSQKYISPFHPYHYCLAALLDRYSGWLNLRNTMGDVIAESRGTHEDRQLTQSYRRVYESGTLLFSYEHHQRALSSRDIKMASKAANIAGLQLADILAYPIKQSYLIEKGRITDSLGAFSRKICKAVADKFNMNKSKNQVEGYGKIML